VIQIKKKMMIEKRKKQENGTIGKMNTKKELVTEIKE
jgi:hypothetical protein